MKSITPVISIILLVALTITASGAAYFFIMSTTSDLKSGVDINNNPITDSSRLNLVSITGSKAIVRNDGTSPVTEVVMFVNNELLNYTLDTPILPGQLKEISFTAQEAGEDLEIKIIYNSGKTVTDISLAKVNTEASGFIVDYSPRVISASIIQNATHLNGYCLATVHNVSIESEYYYEWLLNDESELNGSFIENHDDFNYLLSIISLADGDWKFKCQVGNGTFNSSWKESVILIVGGEEPDNNSVNCLANDSENIWFTGTTTGNNSACCGDDGTLDDFYNGTIATTEFFCQDGFLTEQSIDVNQTICEQYNHIWFTGTTTGNNSACCGDDVIENFTNLSHICNNGVIINEADYSLSNCLANNLTNIWFTGTVTGSNDACCGDDSIESFSNGTNSCVNNSYYDIFTGIIELSDVNVTLNGIDEYDQSGWSVSSGDFNGDGISDVLIGAHYADPNSDNSGESYIVFGSDSLSGIIELNTANVTFNGIDEYDHSGISVSSGDFNGDGIADVLIGAYDADPNEIIAAGQSYIVFGSSELNGVINLTNANVTLNGINVGDHSGWSVSSGDFNGDGFDDVLIGAYSASPNDNFGAGESYVVFGSESLTGIINLTDANIILNGIDGNDRSGKIVSSGDFNGDGFDDVLIGADYADPNGHGMAGESYVVFGSSELNGVINLTNANVTLNGINAGDNSGNSVSSGDFNGDGIDDVLIGAPHVNITEMFSNGFGESYVVFGSESLTGIINLTNANVTFKGIDMSDMSGIRVNSGDFNGDGISDVLIGATGANPNGHDYAGESYVVFGSESLYGNISLTNANVTLNGIDVDDHSGYSFSSGDFNGDGISDVLIGAYSASPNGVQSGESYVMYVSRLVE
jgi:flagellin-like protein